MKTRIKNYQVIKDAELNFEPGITAIIGDSNNGKSSIIRAIEAAINNKGGSSFINYDAEACEVTIEDNDHKIVWSKHNQSRKSFYDIDGKQLNKIGQTQLEEVGELLNMPEVTVNNDKFRLNFWKQMDYPFLVGKTAYQLFDFISKSKEQELISDLQDQSTTSFKQLKKDIEYKEAQVDSKTTDIEELQQEAKALEKFNDINVEQLEALISIYDELDTKIELLSDTKAKIKDNKDIYDSVNASHLMLKKQLEKVENYLDIFNALTQKLDSLESTAESIAKGKKYIADIDKSINSNKEKVTKLDKIIDDYESLSQKLTDFDDLIETLESILSQIETQKKTIDSLETEIKDTQEELSEFKVCPLCGNSLEGGHSHGE